jgi:hypothetical protein
MPTRPYLSGEPGVGILHLLAGHEVQFAADPEQNEFHRILKVGVDGRGEAMVSIAMDLAPHERRAVSESPSIQQSKALWEESVCRPEKQRAVILCWHLHRLDLSVGAWSVSRDLQPVGAPRLVILWRGRVAASTVPRLTCCDPR